MLLKRTYMYVKTDDVFANNTLFCIGWTIVFCNDFYVYLILHVKLPSTDIHTYVESFVTLF